MPEHIYISKVTGNTGGNMVNAREEFLEETKSRDILCSRITRGDDYGDDRRTYILKKGFSEKDFSDFIKTLDIEYDDGYGGQNLFGYIWYKDGTWSERGVYDGSEWWSYKTCPEVNKECL